VREKEKRGVVLVVRVWVGRGGVVGAVEGRKMFDRYLLDEVLFTTLERDGVDDALALDTLEASLDDVELGRVDHEGDFGDVGVSNSELQELLHGSDTIEETFVKVKVQNLGTFLDLLTSNFKSLLVVTSHNQVLEALGTSNVAAFTNIDEDEFRTESESLEAGETHILVDRLGLAGSNVSTGAGNLTDVVRGGTAATASNV